MKYKKIIFISAIAITTVTILYRFSGNILKSNNTIPSARVKSTISTQTDVKSRVEVSATPIKLLAGKEAQFDISFSTHSVKLYYDIAKIAQLTDDSGNIYKSLSWTGGKGGHHIEGVLTFPTIPKLTKKVILTIPGIDNQNRVFTWTL